MSIKAKLTCLFFDQVNIQGQSCEGRSGAMPPSTELSTDAVDNITNVVGTRGSGSLLADLA
jgi:hypothetical protein